MSLFPFSSNYLLRYAYHDEKHYLGNGTREPEECSSDIRAEIERLIRYKPYGLFFIKAEDALSNLELQIAFDGAQEARIGGKLIRLLRCGIDDSQRNA